jgi:hypothetical protein
MRPPHPVTVYYFETPDKAQRCYVKSRIRATVAAIDHCGGRILIDTGKEVPVEEVSPSGFYIFGTSC